MTPHARQARWVTARERHLLRPVRSSVPVAPVVVIGIGTIVVGLVIVITARIIAVIIIPMIAVARIITVVPVAGIVVVIIPPVIGGVLNERRCRSLTR